MLVAGTAIFLYYFFVMIYVGYLVMTGKHQPAAITGAFLMVLTFGLPFFVCTALAWRQPRLGGISGIILSLFIAIMMNFLDTQSTPLIFGCVFISLLIIFLSGSVWSIISEERHGG